MSIEFLPFDTSRCSLHDLRGERVATATTRTPATTATSKSTLSAKRLAANRRNAQRSTGPRTAAGKQRVGRNALKHGLCQTFGSRLPSESGPAYNTFIDELREQLRPRSVMQLTLFPQICDLAWRLNRLPEAQSKIFLEELAKAQDPPHRPDHPLQGAHDPQDTHDLGRALDLQGAGRSPGRSTAPPDALDNDHNDHNEKTLRPDDAPAPLSASDVLARRFSDDPTCNGFLLLGRYERALQNQFLRLLRQYDYEKKHHPTTAYDPDEAPVPSEGSELAWSEEKAEAQRRYFETPAGQAHLARIQAQCADGEAAQAVARAQREGPAPSDATAFDRSADGMDAKPTSDSTAPAPTSSAAALPVAPEARQVREARETREAREARESDDPRTREGAAQPLVPFASVPDSDRTTAMREKQTQSNPPINPSSASQTRKSTDSPARAVTKQTHRDSADDLADDHDRADNHNHDPHPPRHPRHPRDPR